MVQSMECGNINMMGRCDGATLLWCSDEGSLMTLDCWEGGFEGCAFDGDLYNCYTHQESFDDCVGRVGDDCASANASGLCGQSANPLGCQASEDAAAAECVEDQVVNGACM
jgi:hypothetical protein